MRGPGPRRWIGNIQRTFVFTMRVRGLCQLGECPASLIRRPSPLSVSSSVQEGSRVSSTVHPRSKLRPAPRVSRASRRRRSRSLERCPRTLCTNPIDPRSQSETRGRRGGLNQLDALRRNSILVRPALHSSEAPTASALMSCALRPPSMPATSYSTWTCRHIASRAAPSYGACCLCLLELVHARPTARTFDSTRATTTLRVNPDLPQA